MTSGLGGRMTFVLGPLLVLVHRAPLLTCSSTWLRPPVPAEVGSRPGGGDGRSQSSARKRSDRGVTAGTGHRMGASKGLKKLRTPLSLPLLRGVASPKAKRVSSSLALEPLNWSG